MNTNEVIKKKFLIRDDDLPPYFSWIPGGATRHHLAELFFELGYTKGAEIGVYVGRYSQELLDCNPNLELLCIDGWPVYQGVSKRVQGIYYERCVRRLTPYGDRAKIIKMLSKEALNHVPDNSLDFVYIDSDHHFDCVMTDIIEWSKKVRIGGIVAGHDYCNVHRGGVITAVNTYVQAHEIHRWYTTKSPNELDPSWFWVREQL